MEKNVIEKADQVVAEESSKGSKLKKAAVSVSWEKLILDTQMNKYDVILLARRWAFELKTKEGETRTMQELIGVADQEILDEKVTAKTILALNHLNTKKLKSLPTASIFDMIPPPIEEESYSKTDKKSKTKS